RPMSLRTRASRPAATSSPEATTASYSALSKCEPASLHQATSSLVLPAMAETTTVTSCPASTSRLTWAATLRMRSTLATEVPPNFITRRDKRASALQGNARLARGDAAAYKGGGATGQRPGPYEVCMSAKPAPSVISAEVARFDALGDSWWDPDGPMAPLHRLTPVRVAWARDCAIRHFRREAEAGPPLMGLEILDVGCGAGLFAEPLARLGGDVLGIDPAPASIGVARRHADETGARLDYRAATLEEVAAEPRRFDIVSAMEVVEHVADPAKFVALAASLLKPGGLFLSSTLNRTLKSFALAIVGAEYVLRWLEPGTHRWEQFVTPEEFSLAARTAGLKVMERRGVSYDPLRRTWRLSEDLSVNYLFAAKKPRA